MQASRSMRLVNSALRCYPRRWRSRHGDEAAEIATLLIQDGTHAWSIACSYLIGAARARLMTGPRRRLGAAVGALLLAAGSLGVPLALSSPAPANAASAAHARAARPRPADPAPAHPRPADRRRAGPQHRGGRGAPRRGGRRDHC